MAKKKSTAPKFSDTSQKKGLLVRQCPSCSKYHHPRAGSCPNCGHKYEPKAKTKKKTIARKPKANSGAKAASGGDNLQAGIAFVTSCGSLKAARKVLDTIEQIKQL